VTGEQLATVNMAPDQFQGDWNYSIRPEKRKKWVSYPDETSKKTAGGDPKM
jgi:hypothetical protein